jgi:hypothetical protein
MTGPAGGSGGSPPMALGFGSPILLCRLRHRTVRRLASDPHCRHARQPDGKG